MAKDDKCIYLSPALEQMEQEQSDFTLAHEFAHAFFDHDEAEPMTQEEVGKNYLDKEKEKAADEQVVKWGYALPDYRRRS